MFFLPEYSNNEKQAYAPFTHTKKNGKARKRMSEKKM